MMLEHKLDLICYRIGVFLIDFNRLGDMPRSHYLLTLSAVINKVIWK